MRLQRNLSASLFMFTSVAILGLQGCGGDTDTARSVSGSANLTGLWRVITKVGISTQRTAAVIDDDGATVSMNDCGLAFHNYTLSRDGNELSGYYFNLAPIKVVDNDTLTYDYSTINRDFAKMDRDALYDMGNFTLGSDAFSTINATSDVCTGFTDSGSVETLVMATRRNGQMLRMTISLSNSLRVGTFSIEPFGNAPATVTLDGEALQSLLGTDSSAILQGTLNISKKGSVFVEGSITGMLDDEVTNVTISFNAEMP